MEHSAGGVRGYPKFADLFGDYNYVACFRKFSKLAYRILFYYQAQLTHLEAHLHELEIVDSLAQDSDRSRYSRDWAFLGDPSGEEHHGEGNGQEDDREQWKTACKIRATLSEYCMTELLHHCRRFSTRSNFGG